LRTPSFTAHPSSVRVACVTPATVVSVDQGRLQDLAHHFMQGCTPSIALANSIACTHARFGRSRLPASQRLWPGRAGTSLDCRTSSARSGFGVRSAASRSMTSAWQQISSRRSKPGAASPSGPWPTSRAMGTPSRYALPTQVARLSHQCCCRSAAHGVCCANVVGISTVVAHDHPSAMLQDVNTARKPRHAHSPPEALRSLEFTAVQHI